MIFRRVRATAVVGRGIRRHDGSGRIWATRTSDEQAAEDLLGGLSAITEPTREIRMVQRNLPDGELVDSVASPRGRHGIRNSTLPRDRASALVETEVLDVADILDIAGRDGGVA